MFFDFGVNCSDGGSVGVALFESGEWFPLTQCAGSAGDGFFQPLSVLPELLLTGEDCPEEVEEPPFIYRLRIGKAIEDPVAVAAIQHHRASLQIRQVSGNIRLRVLQDVLDIADAKFAVQQQIHDP